MALSSHEPLTVVTAAVPREHREALEEIAARDDRTVSYLVRCAVREYLHSGEAVTGGASRNAPPGGRHEA